MLNPVVIRSRGQNLATDGIWIELLSRGSEPVFLGVAARARTKP